MPFFILHINSDAVARLFAPEILVDGVDVILYILLFFFLSSVLTSGFTVKACGVGMLALFFDIKREFIEYFLYQPPP